MYGICTWDLYISPSQSEVAALEDEHEWKIQFQFGCNTMMTDVSLVFSSQIK